MTVALPALIPCEPGPPSNRRRGSEAPPERKKGNRRGLGIAKHDETESRQGHDQWHHDEDGIHAAAEQLSYQHRTEEPGYANDEEHE